MQRTAQENDSEWILTVKIEIRHPVVGYFSTEFWAICNHCGVIVACKTLKFVEEFLHFLEKRSFMVKFSKICSECFHCLTDRRCCVQLS